MATFNMDNYSAITDDEVKVGPSKQNARVKCVIDEYTLGAELAINDELLMNKVPESAIIVDAYVWIPASLGTTGIVSMGLKAYTDLDGNSVAEDDNALVASADAGGQAVLGRATLASVGLHGAQIGKGGVQPFLKCTEASDAGTGLKVKAAVFYILP